MMHLAFVTFGKKKKGGLHTLEAVVAFLMVLSFIILVLPNITKKDDTSAITRNYVYGGLSNLQKTGKLEALATAENLSGIVTELNKTLLSPLKFTVGVSILSSASGTSYPKEGGLASYINFTANTSTLESAKLELQYANATDPVIYINGDQISYHSGVYSGNLETLDILSGIITGQNSIMLNTSNNATINYRLLLVRFNDLESTPANRTINTISYIIAGNSSTFQPTEIRVYVWR